MTSSDDEWYMPELIAFDIAHEQICQEYSPEYFGGEVVLAYKDGTVEYAIEGFDGKYTLLKSYEISKNLEKTADEILVEVIGVVSKSKNQINPKLH